VPARIPRAPYPPAGLLPTLVAMPALVDALEPELELPVEPGEEAVARFSVRNTGDDVNNFTFRILGEPGRWPTDIRVVGEPAGERSADGLPEMDLLPNGKGEVEVTFRPPLTSETAPGLVPYGLLVCSYAARDHKREEDVEAVQQGLLNVGSFHRRAAQLLPRTSRGRFSGKHRLAVDNYGNTAVTAAFAAEDAENALNVRFSPKRVVVEPGTVAFTKVKVKPQRKFLLGPPRAAPFKIFVRFEGDAAEGVADAGAQVPAVEGLYMQRGVVPLLLLPIGALVIAGAILWALLKPQVTATARQLAPAQAAALSNALTRQAIKTAHGDAVLARQQSARQARAARLDAKQTQKQAAQAASAASAAAKQTHEQAAKATSAAVQANTTADKAVTAADKAVQIATPPFTGTPYAQQLALPPNCTKECTSPQPFGAQPFPAQTFYVTDLLVSNPGGGQGTLTLTLGGKPVFVEALAGVGGADLKPSTPLLVQGDGALAAQVSCTQKPCTPSVLVSGFYPANPPDPTGPDGTPTWTRLSRTCRQASTCAVLSVPAKARSYALTDVILENPAGDAGTVTLLRGKQPLLVEGLDPSTASDPPISFSAPIVLKAGEKLTLAVDCGNSGGRQCTPGALLIGVLKLAPPQKP
jgi:hypothetical protein